MSGDGFISRWSRKKSESKAPAVTTPDPVAAVPAEAAPAPLPPVETLTPESDFTPFMKPEVDADTKRKAVKMLFQDPRYNVMDGLDVYIDDYSKPDPLPEGWLAKMTQVARLGEYQEPKPEPAAAEENPPQEVSADALPADTSESESTALADEPLRPKD